MFVRGLCVHISEYFLTFSQRLLWPSLPAYAERHNQLEVSVQGLCSSFQRQYTTLGVWSLLCIAFEISGIISEFFCNLLLISWLLFSFRFLLSLLSTLVVLSAISSLKPHISSHPDVQHLSLFLKNAPPTFYLQLKAVHIMQLLNITLNKDHLAREIFQGNTRRQIMKVLCEWSYKIDPTLYQPPLVTSMLFIFTLVADFWLSRILKNSGGRENEVRTS